MVTLTGPVERWDQSEEAEILVSRVPGVAEVQNRTVLRPPAVRPDPAGVESEIKRAFLRNAALDADNIGVSTSEGTVTLRGTVHSWAELEAAVAVAWAAPGVRAVDNRLEVGS